MCVFLRNSPIPSKSSLLNPWYETGRVPNHTSLAVSSGRCCNNRSDSSLAYVSRYKTHLRYNSLSTLARAQSVSLSGHCANAASPRTPCTTNQGSMPLRAFDNGFVPPAQLEWLASFHVLAADLYSDTQSITQVNGIGEGLCEKED